MTEVESTGAHHQFYEKFNIRQQIAIIFKHLWTVPSHHQVFLAQPRSVAQRCRLLRVRGQVPSSLTPRRAAHARPAPLRLIRDSQNFVRFVNLLLNDTTYLLDEALIKLAEIHGYQERMKNSDAWAALPQVGHGEEKFVRAGPSPILTVFVAAPARHSYHDAVDGAHGGRAEPGHQ